MEQTGSLADVALGAFRLEGIVGVGGEAEVWRARHVTQDVPVAIKVITHRTARSATHVAAFRKEVRAVARLDHPGIVRVLEFGSVDGGAEKASGGRLVQGSPFLAMELLSGGALDPSSALIGWDDLRATLLSLLDALAHAHSRGVIHRDLKPNNMLWAGTDNDRPGLRLTDFGIAQAFGADEDDADPSGTPWYMAPEQHLGAWRDFGPWTDLYALGCVAWELASGHRPFQGHDLFTVTWAHLNTVPGRLEPRVDTPDGFEQWARRFLEKEPRDRFQCAADAAFALRELPEARVFGVPPLPLTWRPERETRRSALRLGGAGLGLHGLRSMPVLGRTAQLDTIWARLQQVWATASPRLVVLRGAAGCGKTRIAEYICERAEEVGGATALRVDHDPMPTVATGLSGMTARTLGCAGLNRAEILHRIEHRLREEGVDDPYEWEALTELVSPAQDWPGESAGFAVRFLDPAQRNAVLQRFLARRAAARPVILWLDDVQWGSHALSLAEHLLEAPPSGVGPVLMVLTVRDESLADRPSEARRINELAARSDTVELKVPPLDVQDCRQLVREVLGLEGELAAAVEQRSGGNPLFAVQLVGDWVRRGLLHPSDRGLRLGDDGRMPQLILPGDIRAIWLDQIERVVDGTGGDTLETLEIAATLGLNVDVFEWNHACSQAGLKAVPSLVDTLLTDGLGDHREDGFSFASELLRETLEQSARDAERSVRWHEACASMLQVRYPPESRGLARRLGTHRAAAGGFTEAAAHLGEAAWELVEVNDYREALQVVAQREAVLRSAGAPADDLRWGECLLLQCGAKMHLGRLDEALEDARKAEVQASRHGWSALLARALGQQGILARLGGNLEEAVERWEEALRLCPDDDKDTHGRLLFYLAAVRRQECAFAVATGLYQQALDLYLEAGNQLGQAQCLHGLGTIAQDTGELDTAEEVFGRLVGLFKRLGNRFGLSQAINGLAGVAHLRARLDEALEGYSEAWDLLTAIGSPASIVTGLNVALIHILRRDLPALGEVLHRIESVRAAPAQRPWLGQLLVYRLPLLADRQDWAGWDLAIERAAELLAERAGAPQDIATVARVAGEIAAEAGQAGRAREALLLARQQWQLLDEKAGVTIIDGLLSRLPTSA